MKSRHPSLQWIKTVLADLEHDRGDPHIADPVGELVETASPPTGGIEPDSDPAGDDAPVIAVP